MNSFRPARGFAALGNWCAAALFCILCCGSRGQTASGATTPTESIPQAPNVVANVDEVSLDVVVHDKKHKPVLDLKPEDIAITDNDLPVKVNGFRLIQGQGNAGHLITMVFDRFDGITARNAKNIAEKILKVLPAAGYSFAVMDFNGRLRLLQSYTTDRKPVEQAIDMATLSLPALRATAAEAAEKNLISVARTGADTAGRHVEIKERAQAQLLLKALQDAQLIVQDQHAAPSLAGLLAIVRAQQQVTERKAIIYFTQNAQMDSHAKEMVHTIGGAASKAGITFYTVDLDALDVGGQHQIENALLNGQAPFNPAPIATSPYTTVIPMQQQSGAPIAGTPSATGPQWGPNQDIAMMTDFMRGNTDKNPFADTTSPMATLAKDTGGAYIDAQSSVRGPLQQMVDDMTIYYQISYSAPAQEYDGKFRTIAVKPLRAGLNIQTKTGYFSLPPGDADGMRPFEAPLIKILGQPQLPADFKFNAKILRFGDLPDGNTSTLAVEVPISELDTKEDTHTNLFSARISVVAQIKDANGTVVEHFGEDIARRGALESLDRDKSMTVSMQRHFIETPGKYDLEIAVLDQNSQKASARHIRFEIPAAAAGPSFSDMVLVRKMDTYNAETDPLEPLHYETGKVVPNLANTVSRDAKSLSLFMILHPESGVKEQPTLEMEVVHNGKPGRRTAMPFRAGIGEGTVPYLATFQSKSLAPGDYEVRAILTQGGKTAVQSIGFTVEGNQLAEAAAPNSPSAGAANSADDAGSFAPIAAVGGQLAISAPASAVPPPSAEEAQALLADARERAVGYASSLPNFMCIEVTNRSVDASGRGNWKHRDTIAELLRYRDRNETHTVVEVNGKAPQSNDHDAIRGLSSTGEFGGVLSAVFSPAAKAEFKWKETDALGGGTVQVFDYSVAKENSSFSVRGANGVEPIVAFHGKVYIDTSTRSVRRISLVADNLPKEIPTHATAIGVDYDYVVINAHDYLMPLSAEVSILQGRHQAELNSIEFRDYKRFGSNVKILDFTPLEKP